MQPSIESPGDAAMFTLRRAQPTDLDRVRELLLLAYGGYASDMPAELFERYVADLPPDEGDLMRTVVIDAGGQILGTARLYPPGAAGALLPADAAWVRAVAVHPDVEGAGIARRLMAWCEHQARHLGAAQLMLHTADFMARAVRLYERIGYRRVPEWDIHAGDYYGTDSSLRAIAYGLDLEPAEAARARNPMGSGLVPSPVCRSQLSGTSSGPTRPGT
jgi:GNAT superfamily N-acetyltransferase